jgi:hypothetical protein
LQSVAIIFLCIAAAVAYGIAHDQITARVCVEYFTIGHAPIFPTDDPTLLGIGWGIVATWWVGALLGVLLAFVARFGRRPKRSAGSLLRPVARLMAVSAVSALGAGVAGWLLARNGAVPLMGPLAREVPSHRHVPFMAVGWTHSASYLVGFIGGIAVIVQVWRERGERTQANKTGRHTSGGTH